MKLAIVCAEPDVVELVLSEGQHELEGYLDPTETRIEGTVWLGPDSRGAELAAAGTRFCMAVDPAWLKKKLLSSAYRSEDFLTVVSRDACVSAASTIGHGALIQKRVVVSRGAVLGAFTKLNIGCQVHHDAHVGDRTTIAPSALVLGNVRIGSDCYVGAGAILRQRVRIGNNVVIGAGAVVVNDIPDGMTVVGNPAKRVLK